MTVSTFNPEKELATLPPITMTEAALAYVRQQIQKKGKGIGLRLRIKTAGCSGKAYKPEIAEAQEKDELMFPMAQDVCVLVSKSDFMRYLKGLNIDFQHQGLNASFKYTNPNEKGACGCGESFIID
ncbi:MAG: iron-sulfur cluster assembly accessory protein [Gammaproteobacteria bacterium]|nr:iron-sulfur cluster assembly accessory protein [Gammaproteobacteria bacterium]